MTVVYIAYALAAIAALALRPTCRMALLWLFAGWLFLPVEAYPAHTIVSLGFTIEVIGTVLPGQVLVTKAWIAPTSVMLGLLLGARGWPGRFRIVWGDLGIAVFCLSPWLAQIAGRIAASQAFEQSAYLFGVWGSSWLTGRALLDSEPARDELLRALRASGLALLPVALLEATRPAWLYGLVYGGHPFRLDGNARYLGFRPLGWFEHGNQYGIWLGLAALAAIALCMPASRRRPEDVVMAGLVVVAAVASQSVGAIMLLLAGLAWLVIGRSLRRLLMIAVIAAVGIGAPLYVTGMLPLQHWAQSTRLGQVVVGHIRASGRGSLAWRVKRDQMAMPLILRAPITGHGVWDWWRPLQAHPWGLPLLIAGQFGLLSLLVLGVTLLAGAVSRLVRGRSSPLSIMVLLAAIDACLNSFVFYPMIVMAGGLALSPRRGAAAARDDDADPDRRPLDKGQTGMGQLGMR